MNAVAFFMLSFLLKFLSGGSFISRVRQKYGQELVSLIHKVDRLTHRYVKLCNDLSFLSKCLELRVYPKFLQFKTANARLNHSSARLKSQHLLLRNELRSKRADCDRVRSQLSGARSVISSKLGNLDSMAFKLWLSTSASNFDKTVKQTHSRKLESLSPDFCVSSLRPDEVIVNLSTYNLSNAEKNVLVLGLNYTLASSNQSDLEYSASLEIAARKIKSNLADVNDWPEVKRLLISGSQPPPSPNPKKRTDSQFSRVLKNLRENHDLYISRPDKGNGVVILNRTDYISKMSDLLSDTSKFIRVTDDIYKLSQRLEQRLNKTLLSLFQAGKIDKFTYEKIRAVGSNPGKLYGLPKTHKAGVPMRPILAAMTCHNYELAKFLVPLLSPLTVSDYTIVDTFNFASEIQCRTDPQRLLMVSLDIESLFTNVPVAETIDIILSKLFANVDDLYHGFTRTEFASLLKLAVEDSFFTIDGKLYKQIDGMAMGSPLGPIFANIFLSHFEGGWLNGAPVRPLLYKRYVDDTLWLLPADSDITSLMQYMNSRHPNMRFTVENENNGAINFIGLTISHSFTNGSHGYATRIYRKPTFTSLYTNFYSYIPLAYRLTVLKCLLVRAYRLCSSLSLFLSEVTTIRSQLLRNAYPGWLLDRMIKRSITALKQTPPPTFGPPKNRLFIGLPYLDKTTDHFRRSLKQICKKFFPHLDVIIYFKPGKRISNFFQVKDTTPVPLRSHVVYEFTCAGCHASYIGQTSRHLRHRVAEHQGVSHLTGRPVKSLCHSSIRDHCSHCHNSDISAQNFKILAGGSSEVELLVKERLLINNRKPLLNGNAGTFELLLS